MQVLKFKTRNVEEIVYIEWCWESIATTGMCFCAWGLVCTCEPHRPAQPPPKAGHPPNLKVQTPSLGSGPLERQGKPTWPAGRRLSTAGYSRTFLAGKPTHGGHDEGEWACLVTGSVTIRREEGREMNLNIHTRLSYSAILEILDITDLYCSPKQQK